MTTCPASAGGERRKAYSYLRFSTPEQSKGDSFRRQTTMAVAYAAKHGLDLDETLTFHDVGVSGYRGKNKDEGRLADFLEAVRVGQVAPGSVLLVEQLDRLSREVPRKAIKVLESIVDSGVAVVTLADGQEYTEARLDTDPMALIMVVLTAQRAHEESATKARRLAQAWVGKREAMATRPLTSVVPAWLRLNRELSRIELIPDRAELVRRIFDLTVAGVGKHEIAKRFNEEGIAPWGRGRIWYRSYIAKILGNTAVVGTAVPHVMDHSSGKRARKALEAVAGYYPAVIPESLFQEVQALGQGHASPAPAAAGLVNVLAGLAKCPRCDATMTRVQKGSKSHPAFVCTHAKQGAGCEYKSVRYDGIEKRLIRVLPGLLRDREGLDAVRWHETEVFHAEETVHAIRGKIENLVEAVAERRSPSLLQRLTGLEAELVRAQAELETLRERRDLHAGPVLGSRIEKAAAALEQGRDGDLDRQGVNLALRGLFKKAVINYPAGTIDFEWSAGGVCKVHYGWTAGPYTGPIPETEATA